MGNVVGNGMWGSSQYCFGKWRWRRSYDFFFHREAKQSSLSRIMFGMERRFKHAATARPDGPAPTIIATGSCVSIDSAVDRRWWPVVIDSIAKKDGKAGGQHCATTRAMTFLCLPIF